MEQGDHEEVGEGQVCWKGSRVTLERWRDYKRTKAVRFVELGYSVEWMPDASNWLDVFVPARHALDQPELRARVTCFLKSSEYGLHGGRISQLMISLRRTSLRGVPLMEEVLYHYDRRNVVDHLSANRHARTLYETVTSVCG